MIFENMMYLFRLHVYFISNTCSDTDLTLPHFVLVPSQDIDFQCHTVYHGSFLCSMTVEVRVIVCFVDIGGIVDHSCLPFLFIINIFFLRQFCARPIM